MADRLRRGAFWRPLLQLFEGSGRLLGIFHDDRLADLEAQRVLGQGLADQQLADLNRKFLAQNLPWHQADADEEGHFRAWELFLPKARITHSAR